MYNRPITKKEVHMANENKPEVLEIDRVSKVEVKYTDVFDVRIPEDTELGKKTREFLGFFEQAKFKFHVMDPETRQIVEQEISGQDLLKGAKEYCGVLSPVAGKINSPIPILPGGKIPIEATVGQYNGTMPTGCATMFAAIPAGNTFLTLPLKIQLSEDYLKRTNYIGTDGKFYPVTLDGVMANELFEACRFKSDDLGSIQFENIVMVPMGAAQRVPKEASIKTEETQRTEIETLYDKVKLVEPVQEKELEAGEKSKGTAALDPLRDIKSQAASRQIV